MAALVQDIHVAYLAYMATHLSGTARAEAISGVLLALPTSTQGHVGNYLNAAVSGAVDNCAIDANTYNAYDNRYQALGLARGQQMLGAAGQLGINTYLRAEDLQRQIERLQNKRIDILATDIPNLQLAKTEVAAVSGFTATTYPLANKALNISINERQAGVAMLDREILRLTERLGSL